MSDKILIVLTCIIGLILFPPIKEFYDDLVTNLLPMASPDSFETAFFIFAPYIVFGTLIFGTVWKLFRSKGTGGDGEL